MRQRKGSIAAFLGGELLDEVIEGGLALVMLVFGFNYFAIENNWLVAVNVLAEKTGLSGTGFTDEIGIMFQSLSEGFPFKYLSNENVQQAMIIGGVLVIIGLIIKVIVAKSKGEFIKDLGKIILVPGIIGLVSLILVQVLTANKINKIFSTENLSNIEHLFSVLDTSAVVWNMMGFLFLFGIYTIISGLILTYVIKSIGNKPLVLLIVGKFLTFIGGFALLYYFIIRLLAIDVVSTTFYGSLMLKLMAYGWYVGKNGFIWSVSFFALGMILYKQGRIIEKMETKIIRKEQTEKFGINDSYNLEFSKPNLRPRPRPIAIVRKKKVKKKKR